MKLRNNECYQVLNESREIRPAGRILVEVKATNIIEMIIFKIL